jgi:hypothetical protein
VSRAWLAGALALLLLAGCDAGAGGRDEAEPAVLDARPPTPLSPALERLCPLTPRWWAPSARALPFVITWTGGYTTRFVRTVDGWEVLDGAPQARVSYRFLRGRRWESPVVEWLRPEADRLLVTHRRVAGRLHRLEPPLPWLVAPLEDGQRWSWEGRVDDTPARVEVRVRRLPHWRGHRDVLAVEHAGQVGALTGVRTALVVPGLGLVGEEASFSDEPGNELTGWTAR